MELYSVTPLPTLLFSCSCYLNGVAVGMGRCERSGACARRCQFCLRTLITVVMTPQSPKRLLQCPHSVSEMCCNQVGSILNQGDVALASKSRATTRGCLSAQLSDVSRCRDPDCLLFACKAVLSMPAVNELQVLQLGRHSVELRTCNFYKKG